jgi:hypothetical protein
MTPQASQEFENRAHDYHRASLLGDLWLFVRRTGKWWLFPVVVALILLGLAAWLSSSAAGPFLYTLF